MMWKTESRHCLDAWEPLELRTLKLKLASLDSNCRCNSDYYEYHPTTSCTKESTSNTIYRLDQNIQTVDYKDTNSFDPIKVTCDNFTTNGFSSNIYKSNDICPACYFTQNMFRVVPIRILKDEEVETKFEMFSCDKSTSKTVQSLEAGTSLTFKPVLKSSYLSFGNNNNESVLDQNKGISHREVTFALEDQNPILANMNNFVTLRSIKPPNTYSHCACARIIDSIRPHCAWSKTREV